MAEPSQATVKKVGIVGTGVIGAGWAALFLAKGFDVVVFVRSPKSEQKFREGLESAQRNLMVRGLAAEATSHLRARVVFNLAEAVSDVDYVQESVTEEMETKQLILREIDEFAAPHVLIGSSSSFIPLILLGARAHRHPERIATVHPTLPQWDAFCEVIGTTPAITAQLATLFRDGLGMDVVAMKKQGHGHVLNYFLMSIFSNANWLLHKGIADVHGVNTALVHVGNILVASGGATDGAVGMIGGGSKEAFLDLSTDVAIGTPIGYLAELLSRTPRVVAKPTLWLLQLIFWPINRLVYRLARRITAWVLRPLLAPAATSPEGVRAAQERILANMRKLENLSGAK